MFFALSKILWYFVVPINIIFILLVSGVIALWTPWKRLGRWLVTGAAVISLFLALIPVGAHFNSWIENRFPQNPELPENVTGIIVLGGALIPGITAARGVLTLNGSVERIVEFAALAEQFPNARLVYTGGSGSLLDQKNKEADLVEPFLIRLGIDPDRIVYENQSRNTHENAVLSFEKLKPKQDEIWILVTSAAHMPRAVGSFRKAGWPGLIPYPVDFHYTGEETFGPPLSPGSGSGRLSSALHEMLGLSFYYLTGKTDAWIPAP